MVTWLTRASLVLVYVCVSSIATGLCQDSGYQLGPAYQSKQFGDALNVSSWPWRYWNGRYLAIHTLDADPKTPVAQFYDASGKMVREAIVWFPSAAKVEIRGLASDPRGDFYVSGTAVNDDGAVVDFIAKLTSDGHVGEVIQEKPFNATHLCATGDGTVWGLGTERHRTPDDSYPMLRQFSTARGQIRAVLDRQSFTTKFRTLEAPYVALRCNTDTVGVLIQPANEWIEVNAATGALRRWQLPELPKQSGITGIALTGDGELFASITENYHAVPAAGLFVLRKGNNGRATWQGVTGTAGAFKDPNRPIADLLGSNGGDLVYLKDRRDGIAYWSKLDVAKNPK